MRKEIFFANYVGERPLQSTWVSTKGNASSFCSMRNEGRAGRRGGRASRHARGREGTHPRIVQQLRNAVQIDLRDARHTCTNWFSYTSSSAFLHGQSTMNSGHLREMTALHNEMPSLEQEMAAYIQRNGGICSACPQARSNPSTGEQELVHSLGNPSPFGQRLPWSNRGRSEYTIQSWRVQAIACTLRGCAPRKAKYPDEPGRGRAFPASPIPQQIVKGQSLALNLRSLPRTCV